MKIKKDKTIKILTTKLPGETEQQYLAWLLYCEAGSIRRLQHVWTGLRQGVGEMSADFVDKLGKPPVVRTLDRWSKNFQWVKRTELKLEEDLLALRNETKRIATSRTHKIAEAFKRSIELKLKQLKKGEDVSASDVKAMWEMFRTELGLSTGKTEVAHTINEEDQKPPTPEEQALGKEIDQVIKNFYDRQRNTTKK